MQYAIAQEYRMSESGMVANAISLAMKFDESLEYNQENFLIIKDFFEKDDTYLI